MKNLTLAVVSIFLVSLLAVSQSGVINEPLEEAEVQPHSILDEIIKAILESMRSKLANLSFKNIDEVVTNPNLNATVSIKDISITDADKFKIENLKSHAIPLKLENLTLTWGDIVASADYDINTAFAVPSIEGPFKIFAKGSAKAILSQLYFTVGAHVELKDYVIQIKPKGLFGFDVKIENAEVTLTSLMGSPDLGNAVGNLLSKILPRLIEDLKKPLFNAFQDDIIRIVNHLLKKSKKNVIEDEKPTPLLDSPEPSWDDWDSNEDVFKQWFDFGMEETEF